MGESKVDAGFMVGLQHRVGGALKKAGDFFSPGQPIPPSAQDDAFGRSWDFPTNYNTNISIKAYESDGIDFLDLELMSRYYLLREVIEARKDSVCKVPFKFVPRDEDDKSPETKKQCADAQKFFDFPDHEHNWPTWLRMLLEDLFVIDAPAVMPRKSLSQSVNGGMWGFEQVHGATIKRLLNADGRTPFPPAPAYMQRIKGNSAVLYTRDDLIYQPRNPRVNHAYGYSPVEQILDIVHQAFMKETNRVAWYTEGNIPDAIGIADPSWTPEKLKAFQEMMDKLEAGEANARIKRKFRLFPPMKELVFPKQEILKDAFDEWIARIICYCFSISPVPFVSNVNRSVGDVLERAGSAEGLEPILGWVEWFVTGLVSQHMSFDKIQFKAQLAENIDIVKRAEADKIYVSIGKTSLDELRARDGQEPLGVTNFILTPQGPIFIGKNAPPPILAPAPVPKDEKPPSPLLAMDEADTKDPNAQAAERQAEQDAGTNKRVAPQTMKAAGDGKKKILKQTPFTNKAEAVADAAKVIREFFHSQRVKAARAGVKILKRKQEGQKATGDGEDEYASMDPDWQLLVPALQKRLAAVGKKAASDAMASLNVKAADMLDLADQGAIDFASSRAAELVGMKWNDAGELVENPDAKWAITEDTRDFLRDQVVTALEKGWSAQDLTDAIVNGSKFSDDRAERIAQWELTNAHARSNLVAWKQSGQVQGKQWLLSEEHDDDDDCDDNADEGIIDLDALFSSGNSSNPAHPTCHCDVVAVLKGGE